MQTLQILNLLFDNVMPVASISMIFVIVQMISSSVTGVTFFYKTVKNKSEMLTLLACLVPCVFIVTYAIVAPLIFGSFVGGGISENAVVLILASTMTVEFFVELAILMILFTFLVVFYKKIYTLSKIQFALSYLFEFITGFALLALYSAWHITQNPYIFADLLVTPFTYLIYGYFAIIYKVLLLAIGLITALIFRDKKQTTTENVNTYDVVDLQESCLKYLSYRKILTSISFIITFFLLFSCIMVAFLYDYGFSYESFIRSCKEMWFLMPFFAWFLVLGISGLFFAIFPRLTPAYRKLEKNDLFRQFYEEFVKDNLEQKMQTETKSFILQTIGLIPRLQIKDPNAVKISPLMQTKPKEKENKLVYIPMFILTIGFMFFDGLWQYFLVFAGVSLGAMFSLIGAVKSKEVARKIMCVVIFLVCAWYTGIHILDIHYINDPFVVNISNVQTSVSVSSRGNRSYYLKGKTEQNESVSFSISKNDYDYIEKYPSLSKNMIIKCLPNTKTVIEYSFNYEDVIESDSFQEFYDLYQKYGNKD